MPRIFHYIERIEMRHRSACRRSQRFAEATLMPVNRCRVSSGKPLKWQEISLAQRVCVLWMKDVETRTGVPLIDAIFNKL